VIGAPDPSAGKALGQRAYTQRPLDASTDVRAVRGIGRGDATVLLPGAGRSRIVTARAQQRIQLDLGAGPGPAEAYHVVDGRLAALPVGASFNAERGVLDWLPGPGFAGAHDFVFVRDGREIPVRVLLEPRAGTRRVAAQQRSHYSNLFRSNTP
jgi:hypothetical protein